MLPETRLTPALRCHCSGVKNRGFPMTGDEVGRKAKVVDESRNSKPELSSAAAHITPPGGDAVDQPDNFAVEHGAGPIGARHECCQGESDEEPDGDEARSGRDERDGENDGGGYEVKKGAAVARAYEVANEAHGEAGEYAAGDGGDAGVADVGSG
nr:circumsporozoite protein-like [Ipomoea batatas]